jgi:hypothetical protein
LNASRRKATKPRFCSPAWQMNTRHFFPVGGLYSRAARALLPPVPAASNSDQALRQAVAVWLLGKRHIQHPLRDCA